MSISDVLSNQWRLPSRAAAGGLLLGLALAAGTPAQPASAQGTPAQRAEKYLRRIARLTGARQVPGGGYWLCAGRRQFLVGGESIRLNSRRRESTCFSAATYPDMLGAEVVASALLQLKSNPKLFQKWRRQPGYMFKADGQIFPGNGLAGWE